VKKTDFILASEQTKTFARYLVGLVGLFVLAEWVTRLELVPTTYLPHASTVVWQVWLLLQDRLFLENVAATLGVWLLSLVIAALISIPMAVALGSSEIAFKVAQPIIDLIRPIPSVCLIPLAVIVWGQGLATKTFLATYAMIWPILYNGIYGVHDIDPIAIETARCFGLPSTSIMFRISLPSAAPFIFTGARVAASVGLIVLVGAELLTGLDKGIGAYILQISSAGGQIDKVFAATTVAGLLGLAINLSFELADRRLFGWSRLGNIEA
jgi:NitT/TauT family transport system permease protein